MLIEPMRLLDDLQLDSQWIWRRKNTRNSLIITTEEELLSDAAAAACKLNQISKIQIAIGSICINKTDRTKESIRPI